MPLAQRFKQKIRPNKFYPPRVADDKLLERDRLLDGHLGPDFQHQYIFLEAQAGQGKTTLAIQYLRRTGTRYLWYQVDREDGDPYLLVLALYMGLCETVPGFSSPDLVEALESGDAHVEDLPGCVNLLWSDLDQALDGPFAIVFDDLHLLDGSEASLHLLDYLLDSAPNSVTFLLLSRRPPRLGAKRIRFGGGTAYLGNSELAFDEEETAKLLRLLVDEVPDPSTVPLLRQRTDGWPIGLVFACHLLASGRSIDSLDGHHHNIDTYFSQEILALFNASEQRVLAQLSLLDEIPLELATEITGQEDIGRLLMLLVERNCFVRALDNDSTIFGIHHLFQQFLQDQAPQLLGRGEMDRILRLAADYCRRQQMVDRAMSYLARATAFGDLEDMMAEHGMSLALSSRQPTLATLIEDLPAEIVGSSGWFSLFAGLVLEDRPPRELRTSLLRALEIFDRQGNARGVLLSLGYIIYYYLSHEPSQTEGVMYLDRADQLFEDIGQELPVAWRSVTAKNIGSGFLYFLTEIDRARHYCHIAENEAERSGSTGLLVEARVMLGFSYLFAGDLAEAVEVIERLDRVQRRGKLNMHSLMISSFVQLKALHMLGPESRFRQVRDLLFREVNPEVLRRLIVEPYTVFWEIDFLVASGRLAEAEQLAARHQGTAMFARVDHLQAEIAIWHMVLRALRGKRENIPRQRAAVALRMLRRSGSRFFRLKFLLSLGQVQALIGCQEEGLEFFDAVVEEAGSHGMAFFEACGRLHRALLSAYMGPRDSNLLEEDLRRGLSLMKQHGYRIIRGFTPVMFNMMLCEALNRGIMRDFCRELSAELLGCHLEPGSKAIPLLGIRALGGFEISFKGRTVMTGEDFTPTERRFFGLLISVPGQKIHVEQVVEELFDQPESGRSSLDSMLSRLRKKTRTMVPDLDLRHYLVMRKGIVRLRNCRVDAVDFENFVLLGLQQSRNNQWWLASGYFLQASALWTGAFASDLLGGLHRVDSHAHRLEDLLCNMALAWGRVLRERDRHARAVDVVEQALAHRPDHEKLAALRYRLYSDLGDRLGAERSLREFTETLCSQGLDQSSIEEYRRRIIGQQRRDGS